MRQSGKGTFVTEWQESLAERPTLKSFTNEMQELGKKAVTPGVDRGRAHAQATSEGVDLLTVGEHQLSVLTNTTRPLEGQSDNVANLALQYHHPAWGTMVRVLGS